MPNGSLTDLIPVTPTSRREAASLLSRIGVALNKRSSIEARCDKRLAKLQQKMTAVQEQKKALSNPELLKATAVANVLIEFVLSRWDELVERGMRTVRFSTGEIRQRDVPRPSFSIKGGDTDAFFKEVRRKGLARKLIRRGADAPNLQALQEDPELAKRLKTVTTIFDTKIEIRPNKSGDVRLEGSLPEDPSDITWEVTKPKRAKVKE
ncbi:MAG TPA: host-nuclease inhibitor Gam family protein [Candidatus Paceibacterota bacterium]|nr:host-nuclease inhibitor Gam family protein [Candidatus Paceibacterota bacterium]